MQCTMHETNEIKNRLHGITDDHSCIVLKFEKFSRHHIDDIHQNPLTLQFIIEVGKHFIAKSVNDSKPNTKKYQLIKLCSVHSLGGLTILYQCHTNYICVPLLLASVTVSQSLLRKNANQDSTQYRVLVAWQFYISVTLIIYVCLSFWPVSQCHKAY